MITCVGTVCVFVNDQDRAKAFYTEKLGFELRRDEPLYPGAANRWVAVAPAGAKTEIILYLPDENWDHYRQVIGKSQAVTLEVENLEQVYEDLKAKGVEFPMGLDKQPWGTSTFVVDSEGNRLLLVEQPAG